MPQKSSPHIPIAKKLTFFSLVITFTSAVFIVGLAAAYERHVFERTTREDLKALAIRVTRLATKSDVFNHNSPEGEHSAFLSTLILRSEILSACIYSIVFVDDHSAKKIQRVHSKFPASMQDCPEFTPDDIKLIKEDKNSTLGIIAPISNTDNQRVYLYLNTHRDRLFNRWRREAPAIFGLFCLTLAGAAWFTARFARWLTAPIEELSKTARLIAEQDDYSRRATKFSNDELGELTDNFNVLLNDFEIEEARLRESEEKFRLLSESSQFGIFQLDMEGHCVYANEALANITGLNVEYILSRNWLSAVHPDDRTSMETNWRHLISTHEHISINCRIISGGTRWVNGDVRLMTQGDDTPIGFIGTMNDITDIKSAQIQLEQMAFYDTLTGLANRRLFRNRLEHVLNNLGRDSQLLGLLLIDLDQFKHINDSLGHDAGDALLKLAAERLQAAVRSSDTVARLGGDEFAVLLPRANDTFAISNVAEKILHSMQEPISLQEQSVRITASIGIAIAPEDSTDAETLVKNADLALYRAKDLGRNNHQFFTADMNSTLVHYITMISDLREAVANHQFHLVYQPQVRIPSEALIGFEALIRWQHPQRGFISPMEFIPVAEDTGLIIPIGRWVIRESCLQLRRLIDQQLVDSTCAMTVNISVKQFQDTELVEFIGATLEEFELLGQQFEIELTETVLMENYEQVVVKLKAIKALGVKVSIDDFGTGYSSLGYLKKLPVDIIKVDKSFVIDIPEDKNNVEITAAVIAMAHSLSYQVVAEGVETAAQLAFLSACKCDFGQGYLFSRPLAPDALETYCREHSGENRKHRSNS